MARPSFSAILILALLLGTTAWAAKDEPATSEVEAEELSAQERSQARSEIAEMLQGVTSRRERLVALGELVFLDRAEGPLGAVAREEFWKMAPGASAVVGQLFESASPESRVEILDRYREHWKVLGQGVSGARSEMARQGLMDDDRQVRRAAAKLVAVRPLPQMVHAAIDAAVVHPELTLAAVMSVATNREFQGCRWALQAGAREGGAVEQAALLAFRRSGPKCKERVMEFLGSEEPDERLLAAEGLLHVAQASDAERMRAWAERWGEQHPEMAERMREAADALDSSVYDPPPEEPVEVRFTMK
jgi:hypothetical protein